MPTSSLTAAQFGQGRSGAHVVIDARPVPGAPSYLSQAPQRGSAFFPNWTACMRWLSSQRDVTYGVIECLGVVTIPAGTWDLRGMSIVGSGDIEAPFATSVPPIFVQPGAKLKNCNGISNGSIILQDGAGPLLQWPQTGQPTSGTFVASNLSITLQGASTFAEVGSGSTVVLWFDGTTALRGGGTGNKNLVNALAGATVSVQARGAPMVIAENVLASAANDQITITASAEALVASQPRAPQTAGQLLVDRLQPTLWAQPAVLVPEQLDGAANRLTIRQATFMYYVSGSNFAVGNTVTITNGTDTETYTAVAGAPGARQFQVGAGVQESMQSLCSQIRANSTYWTTGTPTALPFDVTYPCVVMRRNQNNSSYGDRIYANCAPQLGIANYGAGYAYGTYAYPGDQDFPVLGNMPVSDDQRTTFGWGENSATGGLVVALVDRQPGKLAYRGNRLAGGGTWTPFNEYSPAALIWADPQPTNLQDAVTRLAAAVVGRTAGGVIG